MQGFSHRPIADCVTASGFTGFALGEELAGLPASQGERFEHPERGRFLAPEQGFAHSVRDDSGVIEPGRACRLIPSLQYSRRAAEGAFDSTNGFFVTLLR